MPSLTCATNPIDGLRPRHPYHSRRAVAAMPLPHLPADNTEDGLPGRVSKARTSLYRFAGHSSGRPISTLLLRHVTPLLRKIIGTHLESSESKPAGRYESSWHQLSHRSVKQVLRRERKRTDESFAHT